MVVEQKVTSMTALKIKSYLLEPTGTTFREVWGKKILPLHFLNLHHEFGNSFYSKFWHINQKKFMKQKRQQIDHRVAWRRPFLRFQLHFWDIVAGATHRRRLEQPTEGRSNPPKVGATHRRCASPPCFTFRRQTNAKSTFSFNDDSFLPWSIHLRIQKILLCNQT